MAGCDYPEYGKSSFYQQQMLQNRAGHIQERADQRARMSSIKKTQPGNAENPELNLDMAEYIYSQILAKAEEEDI
jgi:hypothetical protein